MTREYGTLWEGATMEQILLETIMDGPLDGFERGSNALRTRVAFRGDPSE
ncbi:MAG: hypothetical protein LH616_05760 [Ilumatobacteraceae bacterium]|nr:hypothetical protein [Ilumatobacteraceae bacterium]